MEQSQHEYQGLVNVPERKWGSLKQYSKENRLQLKESRGRGVSITR